MTKRILILLLAVCTSCAVQQEKEHQNNANNLQQVIWYKQPASKWMEALPVGNGRLGAMVFGDPGHERIQLNEDSMWAGGLDWGDSKGSEEDLKQIREYLKQGLPHKADNLIVEAFSFKTIRRSHQTLGDLFIDFHNEKTVENYRKELNLNKALVSVSYTSDGNKYTEKVFTSAPDDVLVVHLSTTASEGLNFDLGLSRPKDNGHPTVTVSNPSETEISMQGIVTQYGGIKNSKPFPIDHGVKFEARLKAVAPSGKVESKNGKLSVKGAQNVTLFLVANTSFYHDDYQKKNLTTLKALKNKNFQTILADHIAEYQTFYNRVSLNLGGHELDSVPTDKRLSRYGKGVEDPDLAATLFQHGRYLLISSSRPGSNPANLQGIWNQHIAAPWNADYHLNINLQMNYWPAEVTNLSEMHQPLFDFTERLIERGKKTAKQQYGIERGTVAHQATDLWAAAWMRAEQPYWGSWIHGGGWLSLHFWEHFQFTQDTLFLKTRAYPALKQFAAFYLDWLIKDPKTGKWISVPETSPENSYVAPDGKPAAVSRGAAMGHQIIADVFEHTLAAAKILGIENDFTKEVQTKYKNLYPGIIIGKDGRILEWNKDYEEVEKGHRHISHLYALYPGDEITVKDTAAFKAAEKTIDYRLAHGGAGTGWSRAWMINFEARLLNEKEVEENLNTFIATAVADNFFALHPPFQIDANFGYTAGIAEALLQSHEGFIRILPALPPNWENGSVKGLVARGNVEVGMEWKNNQLLHLTLKSGEAKTVAVKYQDHKVKIHLSGKQEITLDKNLKLIK